MNRIEYLESKFKSKRQLKSLEKKHFPDFEKHAGYMGNGVYIWKDILATDTRELFLMGLLYITGIKFKKV